MIKFLETRTDFFVLFHGDDVNADGIEVPREQATESLAKSACELPLIVFFRARG